MKFQLASFKTTLDAALIEKGNKWFTEGMVRNVKNENDCIWRADIIGPNKQFKVEIEIVGKEVTTVFCNCGPKLCSHVVSLLFELTEKKYKTEKYYPGTEAKVTKNGAVKVVKTPLMKILDNIDEDELKGFVEGYANQNKAFRESFLSVFGTIDIDSHVDRYATIIDSTLKYDYIKDAMDGTRRVLKDAEKNFKEENYEIVFAACKAVLDEWASLVYHEKHAGYVFNDALKQLEKLVDCEDLSDSFKTTFFKYVYELYKSPDIEDYQDGEFWTNAFLRFAPSKEHLQKVITLIDAKVKKTSQYHRDDFLRHRKVIEEALGNYKG